MIKVITMGRTTLIRAALSKDVRVGFPGDGPYVDVVAEPTRGGRAPDGAGEYACRGVTLAGNLFLSVLVAGG